MSEIQKMHDIILQNPDNYSPQEVFQARKAATIERSHAHSQGITIEELRKTNKLLMDDYIRKMDAAIEQDAKIGNITLKEYGRMVMEELHYTCQQKGSKFEFPEGDLLIKYKEIIRYMFGADTEKINSKKFVYIFGRYGNGKSLLVKTNFSVLNKIYRSENPWRYFHIPTIVNQAITDNSIKPFNVLFNCKKNMILDELGDLCEKRKIYGDDKIPMRDLLLDKYDKWISNNGTGQKIIITSNLFPDSSTFYHASLQADTIINFYDEKLLNKMKENYNMIRFPNKSYRDNNVNVLL